MANINSYRSRITLQRLTYVSNNIGGFTVSWNDIDTVWANVKQVSGNEAIKFKQVYPTVSVKILIRYRSDLNPDYRIKYKNTYYNILSVIDIDNMQDELEVLVGGDPSE
jgi:SPP1 family predicted phage head-tail adaptor